MERYIGMDVHAASCTLAVVSQTGKRLKDFPVETNPAVGLIGPTTSGRTEVDFGWPGVIAGATLVTSF